MKSYTTLRNLYGTLTKNTASANLTFGDQMINDFHRHILQKADWPFLHRLRTLSTTASTQFLALPYDVDQVESVFVTVSDTRYTPKPAPSREFWDNLNYSSNTSDIPEYWFVFNGELGLWPTPATSSNTISINAKIKVIDLNTADDTARTITTLANGSTSLTVSAGLTVQMAGFWIRPTFSTTANTGDGQWYEIASVTNATTGTLVRKYGGNSISAGTAACTISQMPLIPEAYHDMLVDYACYRYWHKEKDERYLEFKAKVQQDASAMFAAYGFSDLSMVIDPGEPVVKINPNLTISF